jgi:hypothetical protein
MFCQVCCLSVQLFQAETPKADEWYHASILISSQHARVYVNHNESPSLVVTLLNGRPDGLFGLYSDGLTNDFANLTITKIPTGIVRNKNVRSYDLPLIPKVGFMQRLWSMKIAACDFANLVIKPSIVMRSNIFPFLRNSFAFRQ